MKSASIHISMVLCLLVAITSSAAAQSNWVGTSISDLTSLNLDKCDYRLKHQPPYSIARYYHPIFSSTNAGGVLHFQLSPAQAVTEIFGRTAYGYDYFDAMYRTPETRPMTQYLRVHNFYNPGFELVFVTEAYKELYNSGQTYLVAEHHSLADNELSNFSLEKQCSSSEDELSCKNPTALNVQSASANPSYSSYYDGSKLIDANTGTGWYSTVYATSAELSFQFPQEVILKNINLISTSSSYDPQNVVVMVSEDGVTFNKVSLSSSSSNLNLSLAEATKALAVKLIVGDSPSYYLAYREAEFLGCSN